MCVCINFVWCNATISVCQVHWPFSFFRCSSSLFLNLLVTSQVYSRSYLSPHPTLILPLLSSSIRTLPGGSRKCSMSHQYLFSPLSLLSPSASTTSSNESRNLHCNTLLILVYKTPRHFWRWPRREPLSLYLFFFSSSVKK